MYDFTKKRNTKLVALGVIIIIAAMLITTVLAALI
jgi:hypothetical protein